MNSTELFIAAGEAISIWGKHHNTACIMYVENGKVRCRKAHAASRYQNYTLYISIFEIKRGMTQTRWTSIGTALHNLYCKELACQAHHKH